MQNASEHLYGTAVLAPLSKFATFGQSKLQCDDVPVVRALYCIIS
jgi:hypothetical protein